VQQEGLSRPRSRLNPYAENQQRHASMALLLLCGLFASVSVFACAETVPQDKPKPQLSPRKNTMAQHYPF